MRERDRQRGDPMMEVNDREMDCTQHNPHRQEVSMNCSSKGGRDRQRNNAVKISRRVMDGNQHSSHRQSSRPDGIKQGHLTSNSNKRSPHRQWQQRMTRPRNSPYQSRLSQQSP